MMRYRITSEYEITNFLFAFSSVSHIMYVVYHSGPDFAYIYVDTATDNEPEARVHKGLGTYCNVCKSVLMRLKNT